MNIKVNYLKQIIKEEIKSVLYDQAEKQDIIHAFVEAIETQNIKKLYKDLKFIGVEPLKAIRILKRDDVDPQFYQNASHMHNEMAKMLGVDDEIKIDAFADFPKPDSNDHRTPDKNFLRSPKLPTSTAQIDYRSGEKNYIQEKKK